jgi:hypothetical protein
MASIVVTCKVCKRKIRVNYEPGISYPFIEVDCPACGKPLPLDLPGTYISATQEEWD